MRSTAANGASRPAAFVNTSGDIGVNGVAAVPLNTWTHLAVTYDGATLRLFVNGVQVSTRAVTGLVVTTAGALRIGGNSVWGEYFKGSIDEVRIYNRALTAAGDSDRHEHADSVSSWRDSSTLRLLRVGSVRLRGCNHGPAEERVKKSILK